MYSTDHFIRMIAYLAVGIEGMGKVHVLVCIGMTLTNVERTMLLSVIRNELKIENIAHGVASSIRTFRTVGIADSVVEGVNDIFLHGIGTERMDNPAATFLFPVKKRTGRHTLVDCLDVSDEFHHLQMQFQHGVATVESGAVLQKLAILRCAHTTYSTQGVVQNRICNRPTVVITVSLEEPAVV